MKSVLRCVLSMLVCASMVLSFVSPAGAAARPASLMGTIDNNIAWDYLYHAAAGWDPRTETVPGETFYFLMPDYTGRIIPTTAVDVYALSDSEDVQGAELRVWSGSESLIPMTKVKPITSTFRGKPSHTYDLWKATIPAKPYGTTVYYRVHFWDGSANAYLKTSSGNYFNPLSQHVRGADDDPSNDYSYTVACTVDCNISWTEVLHDSFDPNYRSVVGPVAAGSTPSIKLRLRVKQDDITGARVRLWDAKDDTETYLAMAKDTAFDTDPVTYDYWYVDVPIPSSADILYYFFEINDDVDQDFYTDDDVKFYGGGYGAVRDDFDASKSYQITVYDPAFAVPAWFQRGVVYQIFPDRFRDGDPSNNPPAGRFFYDQPGGSISRSNATNWNTAICDPRSAGGCLGNYSQNFYGGDLAGIIQKINQGYFDQLGITVLYLNPIFRSPSNHKYDTADYLTIDPDFGSLSDFQAMVAAANAHGIKIILDGVFNHTSSDSTYFDRYNRYDASGNLTSPSGKGTDDNSGACEDGGSPYYSWFYFPDTGNPGKDDGVTTVNCPNGPLNADQTYEAWYGYSSLPKLKANSSAVRDLIWNQGTSSVGPYWTNQGASGWRFDVGGDVDPGLTNDATNTYWEGFRAAVRAINPETLTLGEEWGDASVWLLGNEWDSVMNYRFRSAVLNWLFTGCSGNGCTGGTEFQTNDDNISSSSGSIAYISPSQFNARLRSIQEDYPPMAWKAMMNLADSHDTNRLRFMLKKTNNDSDAAAVQRMKELWLFAFTYAGAPTLYYGDEVGLNQDGVFSGGKYEDDPYNRAPYPWSDTPGDFTADVDLQNFMRKMSSIRHSYPALQDGDVQHGLVIDDVNKLYGFARTNGSQTALVALNRDSSPHAVTFNGLNAAPYNLPDGTVLLDVIEGNTYTVSGGGLTVPAVNPTWGVVLLEQDKIDTPAAPGSVTAKAKNSGYVLVEWKLVNQDAGGQPETPTAYSVQRNGSPIGGLTPASYTTPGGKMSYTADYVSASDTFAVCAVNAGGKKACSSPIGAEVTISGSLGSLGSGATVSYTGGSVLADSNGDYNFTVSVGWTGSITPSKTGYIFSPASSTYSSAITSDLSDQDFTTYQETNTTTTLTSAPVPSNYGQSVTLTATVISSGGTPSGNVAFKDGGTTISACSSQALDGSGQATCTTSALSGGTHTLTAEYAGQLQYKASASGSRSHTVNQASTTTTLTSAPAPSNYGQSVTLTATVSSSGGTPSGNVAFKDGATTISACSSQALDGSGQATCTLSSLSGGTHSITAEYAGNSNYNASTSDVYSQVVDKLNTTSVVTASANPSSFGQSVTFTATVSSSTGTPSGNVTFKDGSATIPGCNALVLNGSGQAACTLSSLSGGTYSITAEYAGNTNYNASTSDVYSQVVDKLNTTSTVTASTNPSVYGQSVTFTATVSSSSGTPSGNVAFKDGSVTIPGCDAQVLNGSGQASCTTSALTIASHNITVEYAGSANYNPSTSSVYSQSVTKAAVNVALSSSSPAVVAGQLVILTATVSGSAGTPGGNVTFKDGGVVIPGCDTLTLNGAGQARCSTTALSVGSHSITAEYSGSAIYTANTSTVYTQSVFYGIYLPVVNGQ